MDTRDPLVEPIPKQLFFRTVGVELVLLGQLRIRFLTPVHVAIFRAGNLWGPISGVNPKWPSWF